MAKKVEPATTVTRAAPVCEARESTGDCYGNIFIDTATNKPIIQPMTEIRQQAPKTSPEDSRAQQCGLGAHMEDAMKNENQNTETTEMVTEIAKALSTSKQFSTETRKAARAVLKRAKTSRAAAADVVVGLVAMELALDQVGPWEGTISDAYREMARAGFVGGMASADRRVFEANRAIDEASAQQEEEPVKAPEAPKATQTAQPAAQPAQATDPAPEAPPAKKGRQKAVQASVPGQPIQGIAPQEGKHLGDLVGWSLTGNVHKDKVEALIIKHGLENDIRLPKLTRNSAYRKAIQLCFNAGKKEERMAMAVLVEDNTTKIVHSLVSKNLVDDDDDDAVSTKDAKFSTEIKVGFSKIADQAGATAGGCLITEDDNHPAAVVLRQKYLELTEMYLPDGIRSGFQVAFRAWDACPVLPHGGLWYIPAKHAEKVRVWHEFLRDLGMTALIIPTFDTKETIDSLRESTRNGLESQLSEMLNLLEEYAAMGWDKCRSTTLEKRMEDFDELRNRAELYQAILGTTIDDLKDRVQAAADAVMVKLTAKQAAEVAEAKKEAEEKAAEAETKKAAREAKKAEAQAAKANG